MTEEQSFKILNICAYFLLFSRGMLLSALVYIFNRRSVTKPFKPLLWYSFFGFLIALSEIIFVFLVKKYPQDFIPLLNRYEIDDTFFISPLYYLNEILMFGFAYAYVIGGKYFKPLIAVSVVLFLLEIANTIWLEGYKDSQPVGSFLFSSYNILLAILYIKQFYILKFRSKTKKDSFLVISWAILIQSAFSILIYILTKSLFLSNTVLFYQISIVRMIVEGLCILLMAYGVSLVRKK